MSKLKTRRKNHYRHTNLSPDEYEFDSRSSTGEMLDARTSACSGLTLDRSCSACSTASATSPTGLPEGFFVGLAPADQVSSDSATMLTSDKNMFGGGRRRSPQACVRQGRCQKTPTLTLLAEVLTNSPAWGFFYLETMYFEQLFEVLTLTFRSTCKTGEDVVNLPLLGQLDGLCRCFQWRSYETGVEMAS